jgi:hypothetical protein
MADRAGQHACAESPQRRRAVVRLMDLDWIVRRDIDNARIGGLDRDVVLSLCATVPIFCSAELFKLPAFSASARSVWIIWDTSAGWFTKASPRSVVHDKSSFIFVTMAGKRARAFTAGSPFLAVDRRKVILCDSLGILFNPTVQLNDLQRISAGRQHLRE